MSRAWSKVWFSILEDRVAKKGVYVWGFLAIFRPIWLTRPQPQPIFSLPRSLSRTPREKNNEPGTAENLPLAEPHKSNAWPKKRRFCNVKIAWIRKQKESEAEETAGSAAADDDDDDDDETVEGAARQKIHSDESP